MTIVAKAPKTEKLHPMQVINVNACEWLQKINVIDFFIMKTYRTRQIKNTKHNERKLLKKTQLYCIE